MKCNKPPSLCVICGPFVNHGHLFMSWYCASDLPDIHSSKSVDADALYVDASKVVCSL